MQKYMARGIGIVCLVLSLVAGQCAPGSSVAAGVTPSPAEGAASDVAQTPSPTGSVEPDVTQPPSTVTPSPTVTPAQPVSASPLPTMPSTPEPTQTGIPTPTPVHKKYILTNSGAKYAKGGQAGIRYHKVRSRKVYQIRSYTTDTVQLKMSQPSTFQVYGGGSRKEVKKGLATVSGKGLVKCHRKGKDEELHTLIRATSKTTGEVQYVYIYFQKRLSCGNGTTVILFEKYSGLLNVNYAKGRVAFSIGNRKKATVSKKGRVQALRHGVTYVTIKVRGSQNNQVKVKVIVKKEPWIVSKNDTVYDYEDMTKDLRDLAKKYHGKVGLDSIGKSYDDREIWCLRIGSKDAGKRLVIDAAIHGREWKNPQVIMRQAEDVLRDYREYRKRFHDTCIYIIPMGNPDGVSISQYGFRAIRSKKLRVKCRKIGHSSIWKANARGVNLNNNFPAGFHEGRSKKPHYMNYFGKKAGSEKETRALMALIDQVRPKAVINLHSTGSILYWNFNVDGERHERLYELATKIRSFNGYAMMPKSGSTDGAGGFADWLVYAKKITSVTIETGTVVCPLPHSQYDSIYRKNNGMFRWFMTEY